MCITESESKLTLTTTKTAYRDFYSIGFILLGKMTSSVFYINYNHMNEHT